MSQTFDLNKLITVDEAKALLGILNKVEFPTEHSDFKDLDKAKELLQLMLAAKEGLSALGNNVGMLMADEAKEIEKRISDGEKPEDVFVDYSFDKRIKQMEDYIFVGDLYKVKRKIETAVEVVDVERELSPELNELIDTLRDNSKNFLNKMNDEGDEDEE